MIEPPLQGAPAPSLDELAGESGLTAEQVANRRQTARRAFGRIPREHTVEYASSEAEIESEVGLNEILAQHTGQPVDVVARDTEGDFFLTAEEAVQYGIVDRVVNKRKNN